MLGKESHVTRHKVYAGEGLDGVGKTTALKLLAEQTGGRYLYCTDGYPLKRWRSKFDGAPMEISYLYYLTLNMFNYFRIEGMRKEGNVFVDRTALSTVAVHKAMGLNPAWLKFMPQAFLNQYDWMLYFTLSEEERRRRIGAREKSVGILSRGDQKSLELANQIDREFLAIFPGKTLVIATDNKTPQEIVDILKLLVSQP